VDAKTRIAQIEKGGISSAGKRHLLRHLRGERLTQRQAILAKCCDCMCYHADGRTDCLMPHCSLHPFRPYRDERLPPKRAKGSRRTTSTSGIRG